MAQPQSSNSPQTNASEQAFKMSAKENMATCLICLGMAGSGKTTFVQVVLVNAIQC